MRRRSIERQEEVNRERSFLDSTYTLPPIHTWGFHVNPSVDPSAPNQNSRTKKLLLPDRKSGSSLKQLLQTLSIGHEGVSSR